MVWHIYRGGRGEELLLANDSTFIGSSSESPTAPPETCAVRTRKSIRAFDRKHTFRERGMGGHNLHRGDHLGNHPCRSRDRDPC